MPQHPAKLARAADAPLASVVVCTFNGEKYLREQLQSLLAQTWPFLEILILDDASTDGTQSIIEEFTNKPGVSAFFSQENRGVNLNFEKGIALAAGKYIFLCDQDDIWLENKVELLIENLGDNLLIYHDSECLQHTVRTGRKSSDVMNMVSGHCALSLAYRNCISGHCMMFRDELKAYLSPAPGKIMYDWWIAYTAANAGSIAFLDRTLVLYRQHESNQTDMFKVNLPERPVMTGSERLQTKTYWQTCILPVFACSPVSETRLAARLQKLLMLYRGREETAYHLGLVLFLLFNASIFKIDKKNNLHRLTFIFNEGFNARLKANFFVFKQGLKSKRNKK